MKRVVISGLICMAILFELLTFACCGVKNARLQVVLTDYAAVLESNGYFRSSRFKGLKWIMHSFCRTSSC